MKVDYAVPSQGLVRGSCVGKTPKPTSYSMTASFGRGRVSCPLQLRLLLQPTSKTKRAFLVFFEDSCIVSLIKQLEIARVSVDVESNVNQNMAWSGLSADPHGSPRLHSSLAIQRVCFLTRRGFVLERAFSFASKEQYKFENGSLF